MFITLCVRFFLFGFEGGMRDLTVFVSGYCLSFYPFTLKTLIQTS